MNAGLISLPSGVNHGMLRRADDKCGVYFQLRAQRSIPVAQKVTDPRKPIPQDFSLYHLKHKTLFEGRRVDDVTFIQSGLTERAARREALFCRIDEATFADVVFDRKEMVQ